MEALHHNPDPARNQPETPNRGSISNPLQKLKQNLVFKSKWAELNGAMGDLGTYIPIVLALTLSENLDLGTTLILTGVYNFATGLIYGVPMPVQPMKSIAAVAISNPSFGIHEVMAAGICTGAILFVLGVTGLMHLVYKLIPISVVRGIQLAQGLSFAMTAVKYIRNVQNFSKSKPVGDQRPWLGLDGLLLALICACFIIIVSGSGEQDENNDDDMPHEETERRTRVSRLMGKIIASLPSAFIIFLLGLLLAIIRGPNKAVKGFKFGPSSIEVIKISKHSWKEGFIKGTIPQLPLSILNSVIAVCKLSNDLFPEKKDVSATSVSITVGLMNLVGCWFGAMPCFHGAGGLAGQYKFVSGWCFGGVVVVCWIELAMCARDMNTKGDSFVMLICTAVSLVGLSAALGFLCGMVVHLLVSLRRLGDDGQSCSTFWFRREHGRETYVN
ncbi:hypothetical protein BUALT_Bualt13G0033900 [Buddleja alternifolia]|uniref:Molybdate transporter 1 n=1 Tax=Buddleja alternifolia TaxID=168488 RepID=A0AAV6WSX5_9LAMI|nr:hypothetical protein BUALT_Bualt13G0033900 [Buddleja alternifolia]